MSARTKHFLRIMSNFFQGNFCVWSRISQPILGIFQVLIDFLLICSPFIETVIRFVGTTTDQLSFLGTPPPPCAFCDLDPHLQQLLPVHITSVDNFIRDQGADQLGANGKPTLVPVSQPNALITGKLLIV